MVNKRQHELELIAAFSEIPTSNLAPANLAPKNSVSTLSLCSYIAIGLVVLAYGSIFCFCKIRERRRKRGKKEQPIKGLFTSGKVVVKNNAPYPEPFVTGGKNKVVIVGIFQNYYPSYGGDYCEVRTNTKICIFLCAHF